MSDFKQTVQSAALHDGPKAARNQGGAEAQRGQPRPIPGTTGTAGAALWPAEWPTAEDIAPALNRFMQFAAETFPQATGRSTLVHLQREAAELLAAVDADDTAAMRAEVPDVVVLALQVGMRLLGHDLAAALDDKLTTNRERRWGEPDVDGVVEHVRLFSAGDILRYDSGPTALMLVTEVHPGHGGRVALYGGEQCLGGSANAYHRDCRLATVEEREVWQSKAYSRRWGLGLPAGHVEFMVDDDPDHDCPRCGAEAAGPDPCRDCEDPEGEW